MPAAASSASPLLTAISNPKRSAALEVHVALLLLLGLLLARPGSSAAADGGLPHTAPPVAADDVEPDSLHAPMHREQLRSLQRDLATCLCARGLPQALYACAQRLYDAFKALAPVEGGDGIGAGGAGGGSGNGLLTVKETAPEMRTLAPFFTDDYAKAHVDPFVECHRLALDAILRLAQRLHLPGGRIPPAAAPTAAAPVPFAPAAAFGAATAVSGTAASVSTAASAIAAASATAAATMEGSAESEGEQLLSRWLVLLCHVIHSTATSFARKQAKKHLLHLCGSKVRYLEVRDRGLADAELKRIRQILCQPPAPDSTPDSTAPVTGSSITSAVSMDEVLPPQPLHLPYEQLVTLCSSLQRLQEMACELDDLAHESVNLVSASRASSLSDCEINSGCTVACRGSASR
jgi:hypothetical protein